MEKEKVSIFCLTYNHSEYIRDALEGMLKQKAPFSYSIFVFDDASDDGTSEILQEYQNKHKNILTVYTAKENTYEKKERDELLQKLYDKYLRGEYIAWCEGDDVWIDEHKLAIQVEYMDNNPQCMMTTHAYLLKDYRKHPAEEHIIRFGNENRCLNAEEIILNTHGNLATASLVMRRKIFFQDKAYPACDVGDKPTQLYALCYGNICYINKVMSVYRYMHEGSWSQNMSEISERKMAHTLNFAGFLKRYDKYSDYQYTDLISQEIINYLYLAVPEKLSVKEYENIKGRLYQNVKAEFSAWINQIEVIYYWLKGMYSIEKSEKEKIQGYQYVCIMGYGNYGKIVAENLRNNGINYVGHIVSSLDKEEKTNMNLWEVKTYPYDKTQTIVIVGISQRSRNGIIEMLNKCGFYQILTPLWFSGI